MLASMNGNKMFSNSTLPTEYGNSLAVLYMIVLIGGIIGVILMSRNLMSNMLSVSRVSVINLLVVHILFLLTVPFRIYYYISHKWKLGLSFCKLVSSLLHIHMYISFFFYAIILCTRILANVEWRHRLEFYRDLHAVIASVTIWAIIVAFVIPYTIVYGSELPEGYDQCFAFGSALSSTKVKVLNYIVCVVVLLIWMILASCQCYLLWCAHRKYGNDSSRHQEFWAQIKSTYFVLIMLICFVPYQAFRIYYVAKYRHELEKVNEVFLAVTAFSCFDMLVFAGRGMWQPVYYMCCVS